MIANQAQPLFTPTIQASFREPQLSAAPQGVSSLVKIYPLDVHEGLIELSPDRFVVGRDEKSDLWIDEGSVSRRHASIELVEGQYCVRDLGSTNGTYVNDQRVTSALLKAGDRLRFGNHIFKVLSSNDLEGQFLETVYSRMIRDGLTGAFNKRYLMDLLERDIGRSCRYRRPLSVALLDLDRFKSINDTHGHLIGDEVLVEFSRRLKSSLRQDDVFARYGGEEFALVMCEATLEQALLVAENCRRIVAEKPFETSAGVLEVTTSVGVASIGEATITTRSLLAVADAKLYEAKRGGRNRVAG